MNLPERNNVVDKSTEEKILTEVITKVSNHPVCNAKVILGALSETLYLERVRASEVEKTMMTNKVLEALAAKKEKPTG